MQEPQSGQDQAQNQVAQPLTEGESATTTPDTQPPQAQAVLNPEELQQKALNVVVFHIGAVRKAVPGTGALKATLPREDAMAVWHSLKLLAGDEDANPLLVTQARIHKPDRKPSA